MRLSPIIFVTSLGIITGTEDINAKKLLNIAMLHGEQGLISNGTTASKTHNLNAEKYSEVNHSKSASHEASTTSKHQSLHDRNTEATNTKTVSDARFKQNATSNPSGQDGTVGSSDTTRTDTSSVSEPSGDTHYTAEQKKMHSVNYTTDKKNESNTSYTASQKNMSDKRYTTDQKEAPGLRYTEDNASGTRNITDKVGTVGGTSGTANTNSSPRMSEDLHTNLTINTSTSDHVQTDGRVTITSDHVTSTPRLTDKADSTKTATEHGNLLRTMWKWLVGGGSLLMVLGFLGPMVFKSMSKCKNNRQG